MNGICIVTLAALAVAGSTLAQSASLSQAGRQLVDQLSRANAAEVQLGDLAAQKGSASAVKDFGQRMVKDHTDLQQQLQKWAEQHRLKPPTTPSRAQQDELAKLRALSGTSFDQAYMKLMLRDHQKDVAELQQQLEKATDSNLKQMVEKTLPILENHLRVAEHAAGAIGLSAAAGLNRPEHPASAK